MPARLKPSLPLDGQPERTAAEDEVSPHRRTRNVLDDPRPATLSEPGPNRPEYPGSAFCLLTVQARLHVVFTRRAGVDRVEPVQRERQRIGPHEGERVAGLRPDVDPGDVEPGPRVPHGRAPGTAEKVQQAPAHGRPRSAQERRSPAAIAVTADTAVRARTGGAAAARGWRRRAVVTASRSGGGHRGRGGGGRGARAS